MPLRGARIGRFVVLAAVCAATVPAAATAAGWSPAGAMPDGARAGHAAVLLKDGRVLVVGGDRYDAPALASADLFDPATNSWITGAGRPPDMSTGRFYPTATLLGNGKVLVAGGDAGSDPPSASAELYDPATNAWSSAGAMSAPRYVATATRLANGKVLVAGGYSASGTSVASADLYDPAANAWASGAERPPDMHRARANATATLLASGKVLVAGGFDPDGNPRAGAELYDPATNGWTAAGKMLQARGSAVAARLPHGNVLVAGGGVGDSPLPSSELYRPAANGWTRGPAKPGDMEPDQSWFGGRINFAGVSLHGGRVLVTGGGFFFYPYQGYPCLASSELYGPDTRRWTPGGDMSSCRFLHTATRLGDGRVLVAGGYASGPFPIDSAELYTPPPPPPRLAITHLGVSPFNFRAEGSGPAPSSSKRTFEVGTTVAYKDSRAASTRFTVLGRRANGQLVRLHTFVHADKAGANSFRFDGRVKGHPLAPGLYWLAAVPHDGFATAPPVSRKFRIRP